MDDLTKRTFVDRIREQVATIDKNDIEYLGINIYSDGSKKYKIYLYDNKFIGKKACANLDFISSLYSDDKIRHSDIRFDNFNNYESVYNFSLDYCSSLEYKTFIDNLSRLFPSIKNDLFVSFFENIKISDQDVSSLYYLGIEYANNNWSLTKIYYRLRDVYYDTNKNKYVYKLDNNKYKTAKNYCNSNFVSNVCDLVDGLIDNGYSFWMSGIDFSKEKREKVKLYLYKKDSDLRSVYSILSSQFQIDEDILSLDSDFRLEIVAVGENSNGSKILQLYYRIR